MKRRALVSLAAVAALLFSTGRALAEEGSGVRTRIGSSLAGGVLIVPGLATSGYLGQDFQIGAQFNNVVAVYLSPAVHFLIGEWAGSNASGALILDFTFNDTISVGLGPEIGDFGVSADHPTPALPGARGLLRGGRLQFAVCPEFLRRVREGSREGIIFGAQIHLLGSGTGFLDGPRNTPGRLLLAPVLTMGLQHF